MMDWEPVYRVATLGFVIGIAFHLAIMYLMNIRAFSLAMMSSYFLFLEPETLPALLRRLFRRDRTPVRRVPSAPETAG